MILTKLKGPKRYLNLINNKPSQFWPCKLGDMKR